MEPLLLDRLKSIAIRWLWLRPSFFIIMAISLSYCVYTLVRTSTDGQDLYFIPSLLLFLWSLLGVTALGSFRYIPPAADPSERWWTKLKTNFTRLAYYLLTILLGGVTLSVIIVTWQLSRAWSELY